MPSPPAELTTLLAKLATSGAEFVLVGDLAAVAQGAPLTTQDVHHRTAENADKLVVFLSGINARARERSDVASGPSRAALLGAGHNLLMTDLGPLDLLDTIEGGRDYEELSRSAVVVDLNSHPVRILDLATLAELKRGATSPEDRLTLAILEETLRRRGT